MLTAQRLRRVLEYLPNTGEFRRIEVHRKHPQYFGKVTGWLTSSGYQSIQVDGCKFMAHRLAFLYMTGRWPPEDIDHIDGDRSNNRWANLRPTSRAVNLQNQRRARSNNIAGFLGVKLHRKRFQARIRVNKKEIYLGVFDTPEQAHAAYIEAKRRLHPGNTL